MGRVNTKIIMEIEGTVNECLLDCIQKHVIADEFDVVDNNGSGHIVIMKGDGYYISFVSLAHNLEGIKNDWCEVLGKIADKHGISRD